ncbi:MAG: T9SS type A sorting domain-containing protein [Bacteroidetes bacterium]|jgi:hypothetical protein|nr:T9SS type A sorting domain-containing protein [Bacteroidota bacterium]MBT6685353.1 T9SS type A sorting domain-containing protein [Bacteroidota bacterium]MBT7145067.1 T9SS type A sorting domain-containing protein [Bacteroidota bacterium]MBT7492752.1 T9SS type A sorting domain-containing protein [Bacteroidota bacterium]
MKKFTLLFSIFAILGFFTLNAQSILTEDFQAGTQPANWGQVTLATDGGWLFGDATAMSSAYFPIPDHTVFACTNDDECDCDKSDDLLYTSTLDFSTATSILMQFDYFFYAATWDVSTEIATIKISTDDGVTWTDIELLDGVADWTSHTIDLTAYAGNSTVKIGFHYNDDGGWLYGFALDNLSIFQPLQFDAKILSSDMSPFVMTGDYDISGMFENAGSDALTSVDVNYSIDGGTVNTFNMTGLNINMLETEAYSHNVQANFPATGSYELTIWLSNPNGNADMNTSNDSLTMTVNVLDQIANRLVLIEHFTQASCGPCASQNPALDALISDPQNIDRVVHIGYHTSWPGYDPMYDFNNTNGLGDARVGYYGVSGVPDCVIAGNQGQGAPSIVSQDKIDTEYNRPGYFEISGLAYAANGELTINLTCEAYADFTTGTIKAHVVLVEYVNYSSAPGSNGETSFPDVMRKMFPGETGTNLNNPTSGTISNLDFTYTIQTPIDINNCHLVVFVQNDSDKDIYMATKIEIGSCSMTLDVVSTNVTTPGGADGTATVTANNGTAPYTYLWDDANAQTTETATGLSEGTYNVTVTDAENCITVVSVDVLDLTFINEVNGKEIGIYPNPTKGKLNITNVENTSVYIYNVLGDEIYSNQNPNSFNTVDISQYANGTYIVKIIAENGVYTKPIFLNK